MLKLHEMSAKAWMFDFSSVFVLIITFFWQTLRIQRRKM